MKNFLMIFLLCGFAINSKAEVKAEASETIELTSILSRLAGYNEYVSNEGGSYISDVDSWFGKYKEHNAVSYFTQLRNQYGIMYDAIASLAIHLTTDNGTLRRHPDISYLDTRWSAVDLDYLLIQLSDFYQETDFHDFFTSHTDYYKRALSAYNNNVLPYFHEEWFHNFYGTNTKDEYKVIIGFCNGNNNYGVKRKVSDGEREVYNICCYSESASSFSDGMSYAGTLIHEFNHSYINPLLDDSPTNAALVQKCGEGLYMLSKNMMNNMAYGNWSTVVNESLVRAASIIYMSENEFPASFIKKEILEQRNIGFTWMAELVKAMYDYTTQRSQYATLNDYYPEIVKCLANYVDNINSIIQEVIGGSEATFVSDGATIKFEQFTKNPLTWSVASAQLNTWQTLTIPATVEGSPVVYIADNAFEGNDMLLSAVLPEGIVGIGNNAFGWTSLNEIELPTTLKTLGSWAFNLSIIRSITIPASVSNIGDRVFNHCQFLKQITVDKDNPVFDSRDNCNAVIETATNTLIAGCPTSTIPESVTALGEFAFTECQQQSDNDNQFTSVTIPAGVKRIGNYCFAFCTNLENVYSMIEEPFPIGPNTFLDNRSNPTLYVPKGSKEKYENTEGWDVFRNIVEMDYVAIRKVNSERGHNANIYNLKGQKISNSRTHSGMRKGVYIKDGKKVVL
jgi:hypothetical protein